MNAKDLSSLMFVGLGILAGLYALSALEGAFMAFTFVSEGGVLRFLLITARFIPFLLLVWLAVHLIRNRDRYTDLLLPMRTSEPAPICATELFNIGISFLGVYLVATALPGVVQWAAEVFVRSLQAAGERSTLVAGQLPSAWALPPSISGLVASLTRMAVGAFLIGYRSRIVRFLLAEHSKEPERAACPKCGHQYRPSEYRPDAEVTLCSRCGTPLPLGSPTGDTSSESDLTHPV